MEDKLKVQEYEYELPEDYVFEEETRAKLDVLVERTGLTNAEAQEFIDIHVELMERFAEALAE